MRELAIGFVAGWIVSRLFYSWLRVVGESIEMARREGRDLQAAGMLPESSAILGAAPVGHASFMAAAGEPRVRTDADREALDRAEQKRRRKADRRRREARKDGSV